MRLCHFLVLCFSLFSFASQAATLTCTVGLGDSRQVGCGSLSHPVTLEAGQSVLLNLENCSEDPSLASWVIPDEDLLQGLYTRELDNTSLTRFQVPSTFENINNRRLIASCREGIGAERHYFYYNIEPNRLELERADLIYPGTAPLRVGEMGQLYLFYSIDTVLNVYEGSVYPTDDRLQIEVFKNPGGCVAPCYRIDMKPKRGVRRHVVSALTLKADDSENRHHTVSTPIEVEVAPALVDPDEIPDDENPGDIPFDDETPDDPAHDECTTVWYTDNDGDGYGADGTAHEAPCDAIPMEFASLTDGDCDDTDPDVYIDAPEILDDTDNDCDGLIDCADTDFESDLPFCILVSDPEPDVGVPEDDNQSVNDDDTNNTSTNAASGSGCGCDLNGKTKPSDFQKLTWSFLLGLCLTVWSVTRKRAA